MENIANQDESEKCRDIAKKCLENGEYAKAAKFFDKSMKLYPLPGVAALKAKAEEMAEAAAAAAESSSNSRNEDESNGESNGRGSERTRSAPTPSSSAKVPRAAGAGAATAGGASSSQKPFKPDQEKESRNIIALSKKSHYDCMGIKRSASDGEIKSAYKKLARLYHPDKNFAPSAEEAFKAIGSAFETLSDPKKRENYDSYGVDDNNAGGGDRARANPFAGFQTGRNGMHEISPDELFNMFFNQAGAGFKTQFHRSNRAHAPQGQGQGQGQGGLFQQLMQFLPIVLLVLMSFSSFGGNQQQQSKSFVVPRNTQLHGISPKIPFYVSQSFGSMYPIYSSNYKQVEMAVESEYKQFLAVQCGTERQKRKNELASTRYRTHEAREAVENRTLPSCEEYSRRFTRR